MRSKILQCLFSGVVMASVFGSCNAQEAGKKQKTQSAAADAGQPVGGGCDGCEIMYLGMPAEMDATDTSAGWSEKGQRLLVTGIVYKSDAKTVAPDVIIYYWQTDNNGYYSPGNTSGEVRRHGHIRGWVKTDANGKYSIYTIRPAPYPGEDIPAHIHISIKEPAIANEYYIDELVFDDDRLLTTKNRRAMENRGGSGVLRLLDAGEMKVAEHDIFLGLNIPGYPRIDDSNTPGANLQSQSAVQPSSESISESHSTTASKSETGNPNIPESGLQIGEDNPSFTPYHASGPDKGTRTCPVCKYGRFHGVIYFAGGKTDWQQVKSWLSFLEQESISRNKYLKAYFVYGNPLAYSKSSRQAQLEQIAKELNLQHIALTFVPSFEDRETEVYLNKINPSVSNTIIIYRNSNIISKFVNLEPGEEQFKMISAVLDKTRSQYFPTME